VNPLLQFDQTGPYSSASSYIQSLIAGTDQPIDTSPYVQQAQRTFSRDIAPSIKESLGANYGIRYGGAVADTLSRAGRDVSTGLNAQLLDLERERQNRRFGAAQFGAGANAQNTNSLLNLLLGGANTLGVGRGTSGMPAYAPSSSSQLLGTILPIAGSVAGAAFGGPVGAAAGGAIGGYAGSQFGGGGGGSFSGQYGGVNDWYSYLPK
jgi:hypothetical protein